MPRQGTSLAARSLEAGRLLAERDGVTFRVQGTCMYPAVRPGDVLRVEPRRACDVKVGDIAVCRRDGVLFGHRVVGTGTRDGRAFVVTRPDRSRGESDAPAFDDDLLGVVVSTTRHGRPAAFAPADGGWLLVQSHAAGAWWAGARPRVRSSLARALERLQARRPYGILVRWWFAVRRPALAFEVRLPLNDELGDTVYRRLDPAEFDPDSAWRGRALERWTLVARMGAVPEPAAWATFVRGPDKAWRLDDSSVRVRYRGAGLDDEVRRRAEAILATRVRDHVQLG